MEQQKGKEKTYWLDKPKNVLLVVRLLYFTCGAVFFLDFTGLRHGEATWEGLPGFYPLYGFIGCTALVLIAKELRKILMRGEDYYDR
jgi:hypothetical protein